MGAPQYIGSPLYKARHPAQATRNRYPPSKRIVARHKEMLRAELEAMVARGELVKFTNRDGKPGDYYGLPGSAP